MTLISSIKPLSLKWHFRGLLFLFVCIVQNSFSQNTDLDLILASDGGQNNALFGTRISLSEDYLVVGAPSTSSFGAVYVYSKDINGNWSNEQKLTAPEPVINDFFGQSVSISGNTIVVRANKYSTQGVNYITAYVFEVNGDGLWMITQELDVLDTNSYGWGYEVCISDDYLAISRIGEFDLLDPTITQTNGKVFMFEKDANGLWYETQTITPNTIEPDPFFGLDLSIYGDYLVIGNIEYNEAIDGKGAVHVYKKNGNGVWENEVIITASDGVETDCFGRSVSIYENKLIVGNPCSDIYGENSGSVYVYELDGNSNWGNELELFASDEQPDARFGHDVQIYDNKFIVGALNHSTNFSNAGAAYIYNRNGVSDWTEQDMYIAFDANTDYRFGRSVSIFSNRFAIGSRNHDGNGINAGAVYVGAVDCAFSLECPDDLSIETNTGSCEGMISFEDAMLVPEIIDDCGDIILSQISGPVNDDILEVGTYEVIFEATSAEGISENCSFFIEVVDNEAPTALCQDLDYYVLPCGEIYVTPEDVDFGSSDACGIASLNLSQYLFDENSIGSNPVELTVTDSGGNSATCIANIQIDPFLEIDEDSMIEVENITLNYGETVDLALDITIVSGWVYSWYVNGNLFCENCAAISISPETNSTIELIVQDDQNCNSYSDAINIELVVDYSIHIPSIFSPNNDGINDHFQAYFSAGVKPAYELQIRDRWGNIVYHKNGEQNGWNGTYRGKEAADGVYTYILVCSLVNGVEIVETGDICLVR